MSMAIFNSYVKLPEGNTIFSGMNIYLPAMTWGSLGTRVLIHPHMDFALVI